MVKCYSDLHCHSTLFSYNHSLETAWDEEHELFFHSQGDFAKLGRGKVRLVMVSLYPIEQGFITVKPLNLGPGHLSSLLAGVVFSMPVKRAEAIQNYEHDYFEDLIREVEFMASGMDPVVYWNRTGPGKDEVYRYRIVEDFDDLSRLLELNEFLDPCTPREDTIAVVLCIEGAHSLGIGQRNTLYKEELSLQEKLAVNINRLKQLGPPGREGRWSPFYITLSHHFWNQLGGHSISLPNIVHKVLNQEQSLYKGITPLGEFVIGQLLNNTGGQKRVLVDINHMSPKLRHWYYRYLAQRDELVPIIASHTGVNGKKNLADSRIKGKPGTYHDLADALYFKSELFNPWDLLLSDEEVMIIHHSGGIIGINLDQRIMMGKERLSQIKSMASSKSRKQKQEIWIMPFIEQVLYIARLILRETGDPEVIWDNIAVGSDYSGMISPIEAFKDATCFPDFDEALFNGLRSLSDKEPVLSGKTDAEIRDITNLIMWKNNVKFLKKHFHPLPPSDCTSRADRR
jgi:microsomal dipeptidase-like Zn-dependent dipeptidase